MAARKRDNSALAKKLQLRREALAAIDYTPIILETHAGEGLIFLQCYTAVQKGWAIEKEEELLIPMTEQRRGWFCYQGESERLLAEAPRGFNANFIDVDPHGSPWPVFEALFNPNRFTHDRIDLLVHDGSRRFLSIGKGGNRDQRWRVGLMADMATEYGDDLRENYSNIALATLSTLCAPCGYDIKKWKAFYSGHDSHSTHYWATLMKREPDHRSSKVIQKAIHK